MRTLVSILLLVAAALAQGNDRVVLKSGRVLEGTVELDRPDALRIVDRELGAVRVPRVAVRAVEREGQPPDVLGVTPPPDPGEAPTAYIRWQRPDPDEPGGLQTATSRWHQRATDTTLLEVGVVHIGDPEYYGGLQKILDSCDLVMFEGVGRGEVTDEDLAKLDVMLRMQLALRGALGLGFQKDFVDYHRPFWVNSDVDFAELQRELASRGAALPTDNPAVQALLKTVLRAAQGGGRREPRLQHQLKVQVGPVLAQADEIMQRPEFAGMRGAIIEHRNAHVMVDLDRLLAEGPRGRRIAIFYGAGHLPDMDRRLRERDFELQGTSWQTAWSVDARPPAREVRVRALDDIVGAAVSATGADGVEVSVWIGRDEGPAVYARQPDAVRAAASSIKVAYLVELFAAFEEHLDEPMPGLDAILDDPDHPALAHFTAEQRREISAALRGVSVRRVAQMMIHGVGVSNEVYNAAANVTTAVLGGPEALSHRLRARFGDGAAVRRYMLAPRDVTGDNEASAAFLARVLQAVARGELLGLSVATTAAIRDQLFLAVDARRGRHASKTGSLDTDPMTRIRSGYFESADGQRLVYVVMCERPDPGTRDRTAAADDLERCCASLTDRLVDAVRESIAH